MIAWTLRPAGEADRAWLWALHRDTVRAPVEATWGWDEEEQRRRHARRFGARDHLVIIWKGTEVGILGKVLEPDCLRVNVICLLPEHQGHGIGRECMRLVTEEAVRREFPGGYGTTPG